MRSVDFHDFLHRLDSERDARDFLIFVLRWAQAPKDDFETVRAYDRPTAIRVSKELFMLYCLENIELKSHEKH
jgi:hypothetical protein